MTPEELEDWLNARPEETRAQEAVWIASRAAARVLPVLLSEFGSVLLSEFGSEGSELETLCLQALRSVLTSEVASALPSREIKAVARDAFDAISKCTAYGAADDAQIAGAAALSAVQAVSAVENSSPAEAAAAAARFSIAASSAHHLSAGHASSAAHANALAEARYSVAVASDVQYLSTGGLMPNPRPLWPEERRAEFEGIWAEISITLLVSLIPKEDSRQQRVDWSFWIDWNKDLLEGRPQNRALLTDIALIPDADWEKGPAHLNALIAEIVAKHEAAGQDLNASLKSMPEASEGRISETKTAMEQHRSDLPPVFDAILGYIALEIDRLQKRNYVSELDQEEAERQIRTLMTIYKAVERLQALVPNSEEMPVEDAKQAEKLGRLYLSKFKEWPRENADEMIDSSYRFALVGLSTFALPMIGVPVHYALGAGMTVFAGKKLLESAKAAKDLITSKGVD